MPKVIGQSNYVPITLMEYGQIAVIVNEYGNYRNKIVIKNGLGYHILGEATFWQPEIVSDTIMVNILLPGTTKEVVSLI